MNEEKKERRKKVTCVYLGHLAYRGRLLKEIATMQAADYECDLILGNRQMVDDKFDEEYDFPIKAIPVTWEKGQVYFYIKHLWFSWVVAKMIAKANTDIIYCFSIQALMTGVLLKLRKPSVKMIFDSNELFIECFQHKIKKLIWMPIQKLGVSFCDLIIHAEPNRLKYYLEKHGGRNKRHEVLENFPNYRKEMTIKIPKENERVRVVYFGVLGRDRYTKELVEIFHDMEDVDLDIVGYFAEKDVEKEVQEILKKSDKKNVRVLPGIKYSEMPILLENYHVGIALYQNTNINNYYCAPNKVYDYIMNGLTVIANDYPGLHHVIEDGGLGACIKKIDKENFQHALSTIRSKNLWGNINDEVRYRYSWDKQSSEYLTWIADLV